jgi:hypothetical protein
MRTDIIPVWWNWQTRETQNLVPVTGRVGSTPTMGTNTNNALVVELADTHGLEPCAARRGGSTPSGRTSFGNGIHIGPGYAGTDTVIDKEKRL